MPTSIGSSYIPGRRILPGWRLYRQVASVTIRVLDILLKER
jgi:hypothetical protein